MKLLRLLVAAAILFSIQARAETSATLNRIADSHTISLGHRVSSIPFSYYNDKQEVIGYSQDLMMKVVDAVKADLKLPDLKVMLTPVTSQNRISLVQNGTVDIVCGSATNNLERQRQVAFSNTLFVIGTRLLTRKDSGINDFPDLAGKNVVTTAGTTSERLLRKLNEDKKMGMNIISAKDHGESFLTLETGRAVAFMMDDALLAGEMAKAKHPDDWVIVGKPMSREAYGCMMRKDDPAFKKLVDDTFARVMASGEAAEIYKRWFMSPVPPKGMNLNFPMSEDMIEAFKHPNDKAFQ